MRTVARAASSLLGLLLLTGCTSGDGGEDAAPTPAAPASASPSAVQDDVDPADLSRDLLAAAAAEDEQLTPIASQTLEVDRFVDGKMTMVVDVLRVERRDGSTLLTLGLSSPTDPAEGAAPAATVFDEASGNAYFGRIALEDTAAGVRHYPLSWRREVNRDLTPPAPGPLNSCVCPFRQNLHLGPEPVVMDALYGPLPEDLDMVTLWAPDGLTLPDLPVSGG